MLKTGRKGVLVVNVDSFGSKCIEIQPPHSNKYTVTEIVEGKGKAIPLQSLTGPEGSRRLRLPDFKTIGT
jgi:hypothetical protein